MSSIFAKMRQKYKKLKEKAKEKVKKKQKFGFKQHSALLGLNKKEKNTFVLGLFTLGLVKGILFIIATSLFFFIHFNNYINYGDGSLNYNIASILPFETLVHLGLFSLASSAVFYGINTLSFAMTKMFTLYLVIHSVFQLIIAILFSNYYIENYYKQSIFENKLLKIHNNHSKLHFVIRDPILLAPLLINLVMFGSSTIAFFTVNRVRRINCQYVLKFNNNHNSMDNDNNANRTNVITVNDMDLEEEKEERKEIKLGSESESTQELKNMFENSNTNRQQHRLYFQELKTRALAFKFFNEIDKDYCNDFVTDLEHKWLNVLYISIICEWIWFALYCLICVVHHYLVLTSEINYDMHTWQLWSNFNINIGDENTHTNNILSLSDWIDGYTQSFTMTLHRAFIISLIYKLLYANKWKNDLAIMAAATLLLVPFGLNVAYLIKFINESNSNQIEIPLVSLLLILIEAIIHVIMFVCMFNLWYLIDSSQSHMNKGLKIASVEKTKDILNSYIPRITIFDMANINENIWNLSIGSDFSKIIKNRIWANVIGFAILGICCLMVVIENMVSISVFTYYELNNSNVNNKNSGKTVCFILDQFNKVLLWSFHMSTMYFYGFVMSVDYSKKFQFTMKPMANFAAFGGLIISLMPCYHVISDIPRNERSWMTYFVIGSTSTRVVLSLSMIYALNKYKHIDKNDYLKYKKKYDEINDTSSNNKDVVKSKHLKFAFEKKFGTFFIPLYIILIICYIYSSVLQSNWTGDLISMNMIINHDYSGTGSRYKNNSNINWAIFGGEAPLFGAGFHFAYLLSAFLTDTIFTKHWYPSYDLSISFLFCVIFLGAWQIVNLLFVAVWFENNVNLIPIIFSQPVVIFLTILVLVGVAIFVVLCRIDNLFSNKSGFFIDH